ncbi:MAG TPA: N(4)-(beta-N-acetylglucosaminyl)-L-asparaginase [Chitinophagales bacterium]|nr:N(4)-(beta-N-acetylglucosaminyl)-L-asparaginase [Chitinophagales bacterium]
MQSRRKFLRSTSLAAAATWLTSKWSTAEVKEKNEAPVTTGIIVLSTWAFGVQANQKALDVLSNGGKAVDAAEQGVMVVESDRSNTSVGLGGYPDRDGHVTLDACIMDEDGNAGSVSFLEGIEHPISVAKMVMQKTPHVMLSGDGAQQFALENGFQLQRGLTDKAKQGYTEWLQTSGYKPKVGPKNHDTIGLILRTAEGKLAGACTTSGLAFKMHGRVGDSPIIGAGLYVDPLFGAAAATGLGEAVMKICGTHLIVELMRQNYTPQQACIEAVKRITFREKNFSEIQVGFIAMNKNGDTGAFAIQPEFQYALAKEGKNGLFDSQSLYQGEKK